VAQAPADGLDRHPGVETGRERFTNRAAYLKLTSDEMYRLVLVDGFLLHDIPAPPTMD
jgi:hypothetical protein